MRPVGAHDVARPHVLFATIFVAQLGGHTSGVLREGEQLDWPLYLDAETFEVLFQRALGLCLGDEQQEGVGCVVHADVAELDVRRRASSHEGRDLERAPSARDQLVSDAHLLHKL